MSSSYSEALDFIKRHSEVTQDQCEDMALDVEYLLDSLLDVAEELELKIEEQDKLLSSERKALRYLMKHVQLTSNQWGYIQKLYPKLKDK